MLHYNMGLNIVSSCVQLSVIVIILYITTCKTVQWVDYVTSLTHDVITGPDNSRMSVRQQFTQAARGVVARAHAHCVTGSSPDEAPFADKQHWTLRLPCGKVDATITMVTGSREQLLFTTCTWALVAPPGLYWNLTFGYLKLMPSTTGFPIEVFYIAKSDLVRVEWTSDQLPGNYYVYDKMALLLLRRVERFQRLVESPSGFTVMYQVYNSVSGLTAAVSTLEVVVHASNVDFQREVVRNTLTTGGCVGCQHVVMHVKAIMDIRVQMALWGPLTSCYTVSGFDGPSTRLPQLRYQRMKHDDLYKYLVFDLSSAFQITVEIYNYYKLCGNSTDTFKLDVYRTRAQKPRAFKSSEVGRRHLTLPTRNCPTLPHLVFCYYHVSPIVTTREPYPRHKITLEHVHFASPHSQDCSYGGLQILPDRIRDDSKPAVVCSKLISLNGQEKAFELTLPFKDYVTESSAVVRTWSVFLAFYSYTMEGRSGRDDTVTVSITETQCHGVHINCQPQPDDNLPPYERFVNYQYGADLASPTLARNTMCGNHFTSNATFIWKDVILYNSFALCRLSAKGGQRMTNIVPLRETKCIFVQRLPRYAERGDGVKKALRETCGFTVVQDLHHYMFLNESYPLHLDKHACKPPGLKYSVKQTKNILFPCGYYAVRFLKFSWPSDLFADEEVTGRNIDVVMGNQLPHSGSYMLENTDIIIENQAEEGNLYTKISHYDIEFFHLYKVMNAPGK